jgi:hypothetical protein
MDEGKRRALAVLWVVVALLMAVSLQGVDVGSVGGVARVAVIVLSLVLAGVYAFDPRGIVSDRPF